MHEKRVETGSGPLHSAAWMPGTPPTARRAPIVLFHDSLGSVALWRDFPARLAQATDRQVVAYDRLGFGQSGPSRAQLERGFIAGETAHFDAVRTAWNIDAFIAFGHSVGGGMAVECAAAFGTDCVGLITESAQAFVEDRTIKGIEDARIAFADESQMQRLARYHGDKAPWVVSAWIDTWLAPDFRDWSLAQTLPHVHCPVLAIHGDHDAYGSARHPETIVSLSRGEPRRLALLAGCGHVPHREQADIVLAMVQDFVGSIAA
ncbi:alpha/beta hydrolase [Comamonadaceae bacterium PP-2]